VTMDVIMLKPIHQLPVIIGRYMVFLKGKS